MNELMIYNDELNKPANLVQFERMLGKRGAASFISGVLTSIKENPKLAECPPDNVFAEALKGAAYNLPIGNTFGMSFLIPRYSRKHNGQMASFQVGYKGLKQMAMRSKDHVVINVGYLYEGQRIEEDQLTGKVQIVGDKRSGNIVEYFGYLRKVNSYEGFVHWDLNRLEAHRQQYASSNPMWSTNPDDMRRKTVLIDLLNQHATLDFDLSDFADNGAFDSETSGQLDQGEIIESEIIDASPVVEDPLWNPEQHDQPVTNGNIRPLSAEKARDLIQKKALRHFENNRSLTEKQAKIFPLLWRDLFDNQDERYYVTEYLFGVTLSSDLTEVQKLALLDWMTLEKNDEGHLIPSEDAIKERSNMISAALQDKGQQSLGL